MILLPNVPNFSVVRGHALDELMVPSISPSFVVELNLHWGDIFTDLFP